jgi:hypothetical protein
LELARLLPLARFVRFEVYDLDGADFLAVVESFAGDRGDSASFVVRAEPGFLDFVVADFAELRLG